MIESVRGAAVPGQLHRPDDERVAATGGEGDHQGVLVDAAEAGDRVLARARDHLGADVEQRQQVAQVAGEEGHLVDPDDHHPVGAGERRDAGLDLLAGEVADGLLDVRVVGGQRGLELGVVEVEQRAGAAAAVALAMAVLLDRRLLKLGIALEAERLGEADDRRGGGVGAAGELLGGLEGGLVEVVDDVAGDVLLGARELVEALGDVGGERLAVRPRWRPARGGLAARTRSWQQRGGTLSRSCSRRMIRPRPGFPFRRLQAISSFHGGRAAPAERRCGWIAAVDAERGPAPHQPQHDRLRPRAGVGGAPGPARRPCASSATTSPRPTPSTCSGAAGRSGSRSPPLTWSPSAATSRATGGRWPGCAARSSPPTSLWSGSPAFRRRAPGPDCGSRAPRTWR